MQLENFTGVVFIRLCRIVQNAVEINQHRQTAGAVKEQVTELTQSVVAEEVVLFQLEGIRQLGCTRVVAVDTVVVAVADLAKEFLQFVFVGQEVVFPKFPENLLQLILRVDPANEG